jgi:Glycosyltransferase family 87
MGARMLLTSFFYAVIGSQSRRSRYARLLGFMTIYLLGLLLISYLRWQRLADYGYFATLYHRYSLNLIQGQMPYRDFSFDYPPLALLPFVLPQLIKPGDSLNLAEYAWLFLVENSVISVLLGLTVVRIASYFQSWRRCLEVLAVYSLLSMITAPLLLARYDLFPTLLVAIAVAAAIGGHPTQAGIWLGLGFAAKLYPIALVPILSIYYWVNGSYRSLFKVFVGASVALSLTVLPFLLIGVLPAWVEAAVMSGRISLFPSFLHGHQLRGLQIESIPAGIILLGHILGFTPVTVVSNFDAFYIASSIADTVLKWLPTLAFLEFTVVVIACLNCFRNEFKQFGAITNESLLAFLMSALLILIVAGKVLSPQYFGWLLPFAPFLRLRQIGLVAVIFALTIVIYPFSYNSLLELQTPPILLLNARNFLTIVLLIWLVTERLSASKYFSGIKEGSMPT